MIDLASNIFSLSESEELKNLLNNPKDDFQKVISLMEKKVVENTERVIESEKKYRSLITVLTNIGFGIDIVSKDHKIFFQNDVLKENFGDCLGEVCYEKYRGLDHQCDFCQMEETLKFNEIKRNELMGVDDRAYEIISAPYPNPDGTVDKVLEVIIDITERKIVEQKLRESEEKYRILTEQSLMGIFIIQEGRLKYINQTVSEINGYTMDEMLNWTGVDIAKTIYSEDLENIMSRLKRSENGDLDEQSSSIFRLITKGGELKWVEEYNKKIDFEGEPASLVTLIDITKRKLVEDALRESEHFLKKAQAVTHIGYWKLDPLTLEISGSHELFNIFEITQSEATLDSFVEIVHPDDREYDLYHIRRGMEHGEDWDIEHRIITKEGSEKWVHAIGEAVKNENDEISLLVGTVQDITERKLAEQKLKESEEKYRGLINNITDIIFELNLNGKCTYVSNQLFEISGFYPEEMIEQNVFQYLHPEDFLNVTEKVKDAFQKGIRISTDFRLQHKDGFYVPISANFNVIRINGEQKFIGVLRDNTEKKQAEQKLTESEEKYRTLAEKSILGIAILQDDVVQYVNKRLANLFGYTVEEIMEWGKGAFLNVIYPDDRKLVAEQARKKQQGETDYLPQYQFRGIKKNGDLIWLELFSKSINYKGKLADFITIHNITERLKAQQELLKLNQLKSELLRRTSHELKTPLVSIKGFTELLLKVHRDKLDALVISTLNEIEQGCLRLETLIGDILKTAELESGAIQPNKSEEDLSFLVRLCVNEIKGFSKLRNHTINLELQENLITYFEKEQIHQVIGNILNNAVKYTPPRGIIEIKSEVRDEFIVLSVKDNGIGFSEEEKSKIFKQFGKIERYGQGLDIITEGSGLGLFISKKIIELHDGQIWVESEGRNKGSTFYISLPLI